MDTEKILLALNSIIGNYEKFVHIATEIPWFPVEEQHGDWFNTYPLGICGDFTYLVVKGDTLLLIDCGIWD